MIFGWNHFLVTCCSISIHFTTHDIVPFKGNQHIPFSEMACHYSSIKFTKCYRKLYFDSQRFHTRPIWVDNILDSRECSIVQHTRLPYLSSTRNILFFLEKGISTCPITHLIAPFSPSIPPSHLHRALPIWIMKHQVCPKSINCLQFGHLPANNWPPSKPNTCAQSHINVIQKKSGVFHVSP